VALAIEAEKVEFFKDVPGIFAEDPKKNPAASFLKSLSYEEALKIAAGGAKVLNARSILLAQKNGLPLHVRSFFETSVSAQAGTLISDAGGSRRMPPIYEEDIC
jgi:aspartate kinase